MERTEPTLIPEWLKNSASSTGGSSQTRADDDISASRASKNNSSVHNNGHNFGKPSSFERTSSSLYFRRVSGNFRSYSSSGKNPCDRGWEKGKCGSRDQEKSFFEGQHWESSEPEKIHVLDRYEKDGLKRSQSMIYENYRDTGPKKVGTDRIGAGRNSTDGLFSKASLSIGANKALFERDFPSLGAEDRSILPDVGRVPSPGLLTTAIKSLPMNSSTSLGEKWTSALAEVPMSAGSNGSALSSALQVALSGSTSSVSGPTSGLNMAEAVTYGPLRAQTPPQLSDGAQRREELAIKQSKQLIPLTPHMPKNLALNSSDKSRGKAAGQLLPSVLSSTSHTPRGMSAKADTAKSSIPGKLHVLKLAREKNSLISSGKDNMSPTSKAGSSAVAISPSATTGNQKNNLDRKPVLTVLEKRPTFQAQSRNEFFNSVRKKSMEIPSSSADSDSLCSSSVVESSGNAISASFSDKHSNINSLPATDTEAADSPEINECPCLEENVVFNCNGIASNEEELDLNGKKHPWADPIISEEEEAALLRAMGWEENEEEEDGLTEEEISSFRINLIKYVESNPSLRILQGTQLRYMLPFESHKGKSTSTSDGIAELES